VDTDEMVRRLGGLPDDPTPSADVMDLLAEACEPGLVGIPSGRFFGMVMGGTLPAALGADWLTSAWDQNVGLRAVTPAAAAAEEVAGRWLLDLLGLPDGA
jgi:glutamate/tyrosine decarboxylase-like PLP-dependent enzyme